MALASVAKHAGRHAGWQIWEQSDEERDDEDGDDEMWVITGTAPAASQATSKQRAAGVPAIPNCRRKDGETAQRRDNEKGTD